jgi:MFS family permease
LRGLDWFIFFVADVQTGFGPFVAVYLTTQKWTQGDIGLILSAAGFVSLIAQMPGGALVDAAKSERMVAGIAVAAICLSALAYAVYPIFPVVLSAAVTHAAASCVLGPAIAAISLGLVGHAAISDRLGRNARFASAGNALAAGAMGAFGSFLSARSVFIVTVFLLIPALLALRMISPAEIDPERAHGNAPRRPPKPPIRPGALMQNRPLLIFAGCILLFHLANSAMLPLMAGVITMRSSGWAALLIAACIVAPQFVVAALSPWIGTRARIWGRRPLLLIGFAALPIRGLLFATVTNPSLVVVVQVLDGVTAAVFAVMVPLIIADLTRGTGHFNLGQGIIGTATGIGASLSASLAGQVTDHFGSSAAFTGLALIAVVGLLAVYFLMPETRDAPEPE